MRVYGKDWPKKAPPLTDNKTNVYSHYHLLEHCPAWLDNLHNIKEKTT
jgi:hypothetical protein